MTYDGVLYDKAGKTLLACPKNRHGAVKSKKEQKKLRKMHSLALRLKK